jgi:urease accessory protein
MRGDDARLLESPLGWAGRTVLATLWFAAGAALAEERSAALLDAARRAMHGQALNAAAGASAPQAQVVVVRALAPRVEPAMDLLTSIWSAWRLLAWQRAPCVPRVWRT